MKYSKIKTCTAVAACALGVMATAHAADMSTEVGGTPNPQMQRVLDEIAKQHYTPIETLDPKDARKQPNAATAAAAIIKEDGKVMNADSVQKEDDQTISKSGPNIPIRVYTPRGQGPFPVIVYYHGGGFVIATIDTYESSARALCNGANAVVVSVEYRKAPEYKYPAAHDDAFTAYKWVTEHAADINGDPKRIAVAGESAGGNLATAVCLMAKEQKVQPPTFQLLIYPVVDGDMKTESYEKNADAKPLNRAMMKWFFTQYLNDAGNAADPHVAPMKADVSGLPPAMVITDSIDPLMSEGKAYAEKLKAAGVSVQYKNYTGVTHEFFGLGAVVDTAKQAEADAAAALKAAFGAPNSM